MSYPFGLDKLWLNIECQAIYQTSESVLTLWGLGKITDIVKI